MAILSTKTHQGRGATYDTIYIQCVRNYRFIYIFFCVLWLVYKSAVAMCLFHLVSNGFEIATIIFFRSIPVFRCAMWLLPMARVAFIDAFQ